MFADRRDAGVRLAESCAGLREVELVIALPRGGVPVGYEVAQSLELPLDIIGVRKIGAPHQPELALGAIVEGARPELLLDASMCERLGLSRGDLDSTIEHERHELQRRDALYRSGHAPHDVSGRSVIVVDDGIATGSTMLAVLEALRRRGARRLIVATPVGSPEAIRLLWNVADRVIVLDTPGWFRAVGQFYEDFTPTTDEEVVALLRASAAAQQS